jgi:hypothetical protein
MNADLKAIGLSFELCTCIIVRGIINESKVLTAVRGPLTKPEQNNIRRKINILKFIYLITSKCLITLHKQTVKIIIAMQPY